MKTARFKAIMLGGVLGTQMLCAPAFAANYTYDRLNRLVKAEYANMTVTYRYDADGNLTSVKRTDISPKHITFETKGGSTVAELTVKYGETPEKPDDPTKEGYTFIGWYADEELKNRYDFSEPLYENITVYAGWADKMYKILFDAESAGAEYSEKMMANGQIYEDLPTPKKLGYDFSGWFTDDGTPVQNGDTAELSDDLILYAHWSIKEEYRWYYDSKISVYEIRTAEELEAFSTLVNSGLDFAGETVKIMNNIDLGGCDWQPIGGAKYAFDGHFDGQCYEISALNCTKSGTYQGLFGTVGEDAVICDVILSGCVSGEEYAGGLAGENEGLIINCKVDVDVSATGCAGGIVGKNAGSVINCVIAGDVFKDGEESRIAGICGENSGEIRTCVGSGKVDMTAKKWAMVTTSDSNLEKVRYVYYLTVYEFDALDDNAPSESIENPFAFGDRAALKGVGYYYLPYKRTIGYTVTEFVSTAINRGVDEYNQNAKIAARNWFKTAEDSELPCDIEF